MVSLHLIAKANTIVGLLAGRCCSCDVGDRSLNLTEIHWLYVNLVTGWYRFRYIDGSITREASGYARVLTSNTLYLNGTEWLERYHLGPVVIMLNPERGAKDYTVTIVDINGVVHEYTLRKLVDDPSLVAIDAVVFWEDTWWPSTSTLLDNYIDHVIRVTVFVNDTVRIEVMAASGCFLHMFMYSISGLPDFNEVPSIVRKYLENNYRLSASDGVVYVKTHGAGVPPLDSRDIWDPVGDRWVSSWPVVFTLTS